MLRPERMSKVSVAGSKRVLESTIEAVYGMRLLHLSDYDESWQAFDLGRSLEGAEEVNDKLVTVRSLESALGVSPEEADETIVVDEAELEAELASLRERVNDLDDRRSELRTRRRELDEEIDAVEPFADLGLDLDLLSGYDSLVVSVGEGNREAIESTLADSEEIETFEVMSGGRTHAIFAKPAADAGDDVLADALVGVEFAAVPVPDAEGSPEAYVEELEAEKAEVESKLTDVQAELDEIRDEQAGFLLAAEEYLSIEAQKKQAPLSFATTDNAFVAEGWIPTEEYDEFESSLRSAVDGPLDIDEIKRAEYTSTGDHHVEDHEAETPTVEDETRATEEPITADDGEAEAEAEARADGGVVTVDDEPPVVQDNPSVARPFETLIRAVSRPKYSEFDPTVLVFLTFPVMFGFMIGDLGYGVLYTAIGVYMYGKQDGVMKEIGAVAIWAGLFTILFGAYYGFDIFGYHAYALLGFESWPLSKGLSPADQEWALAWLVLSVVFGIIHLNVGYVLSFVSNYKLHDLKHAVYESLSWILLLNGLWIWIFSQHASGPKPGFIFDSIGLLTLGAVEFGGFPVIVGIGGLLAAGLGAVLLAIGEPTELAEVLAPVVNAVSYARIMAVLLAKGGMALAVNLLAFGAYIGDGGDGSFHFIFTPSYLEYVQDHPDSYELVFTGLSTAYEPTAIGVIALVAAILVAVIGHIVVLLLGITAAGIQGVRLEYVEFFGKFYEGGGRSYNPLGYLRQYTTTDD
ncbi:MAG: V-type ATP synthase subunit I [Halohasta sp.]